jgi:hypothetical protein
MKGGLVEPIYDESVDAARHIGTSCHDCSVPIEKDEVVVLAHYPGQPNAQLVFHEDCWVENHRPS